MSLKKINLVSRCYDERRYGLLHTNNANKKGLMKITSNSKLLILDMMVNRSSPTTVFRYCTSRRNRVFFCKLTAEQFPIRKCAPFLESGLLQQQPENDLKWKAVPDIWRTSAEKFGDGVALIDPYHNPPTTLTYKQLEQEIRNFSEGLRVIGVKPEEKLALFSDNSCRWLVADQGIMATGAINVVRGSSSSTEELLLIYNHSNSIALVVDNPEMYNRVAESFYSHATVRFVVLLWGDKSSISSKAEVEGLSIYCYKEIIDLGHQSNMALLSNNYSQECKYEAITTDDVATLVYTSGTTGNPKGVMLTHKNLLHQITNIGDLGPMMPGDRVLSLLPPWHAYERSCEYFIFTHGVEQIYTNIHNFKEDLSRYQPHFLVAVPIIYESLYRGIQKQIAKSSPIRKLVALLFLRISMVYMEAKRIYEGKCLTISTEQPSFFICLLDQLWARVIAALLQPLHMLAKKIIYSKIHASIGISKVGINGGGSLPSFIDTFFEAIDIKVLNGYGLTESSPIVAVRRLNCNVLGSVGRPLQHVEVKIVDADTDETLPPASKGLIKVRGSLVMKGYYKNLKTTEEVIDKDGWLNSGDIGWIAPTVSVGRSRHCGGVIVLEGRAKDTIVLLTGENVEPSEIEEAAMRSSLINQIIVIGQDQRRLGALIVPNKEEVIVAAKRLSILDSNSSDLSKEKMTKLLNEELRKWTSECSFQIGPIIVLDEPFTIDNGLLTPTMKIKRDKVVAQYKEKITNMYK